MTKLHSNGTRLKTFLSLASACGAALLLSGCGLTNVTSVTSPSPITPAVAKTTGIVMGGQQPVAGVTLQLYSVGTTGYGTGATTLGPSFQSLPTGTFYLPSYTCTNNNPIYLVGTGGTPIGASAANPNLALMVGIGPCNTPITFLNLNELTTVASLYALSGFTTPATTLGAGPNIGAPTSNAQGLLNAFAAINKVVDVTKGTVSGPGLPAGATLPTSELNALANILQNCVNSTGGSASDTSTPCGSLFADTTAAATPLDTISAALNIAQHPGTNVAALNSLQASSPAFKPTLDVNTPPSDWTVAISYTGGGLSSPQSVATDAAGQVWVTNTGNNSVTLLDNTGKALSGTGGIAVGNSPYGVAIDQSGNAWIANSGDNTVTELTSSGSLKATLNNNGLNTPKGVAIDGAGNAWITNSGNSTISAYDSGGSALSGSPYSGGGLSAPVSIAINPK